MEYKSTLADLQCVAHLLDPDLGPFLPLQIVGYRFGTFHTVIFGPPTPYTNW